MGRPPPRRTGPVAGDPGVCASPAAAVAAGVDCPMHTGANSDERAKRSTSVRVLMIFLPFIIPLVPEILRSAFIRLLSCARKAVLHLWEGEASMNRFRFRLRFLVCAFFAILPAGALAQAGETISLTVDATHSQEKMLYVHEVIPAKPGPMTIYYPKWIPGEHAPSGPIADLSGLKFDGRRQNRTPNRRVEARPARRLHLPPRHSRRRHAPGRQLRHHRARRPVGH